jgi:hypothetical protein
MIEKDYFSGLYNSFISAKEREIKASNNQNKFNLFFLFYSI